MSYPVVQRIKGNYYLYEAEGVWDPEKKNSKQRRRYIGKCDKDGNLIKESIRNRTIIVSKTFGPHHLMLELMGQSGLFDILCDVYGEDDADVLAALAIMRVLRPGPLRQLSDQMEECFLPELLGLERELTSQFISGFLARIGKDAERRHRLCRGMASGSRAVIFDLTSFQSSSRLLEMLEYGTEYRTTGLPQVNFGLVHSLETGLPFHYKLYPGSVSDVATLRNLLAEISDMGITDAEFVMDRGFYSEANLLDMLKSGMGFTIPVPFNRRIAKELMSESVNPHRDATRTHMFNGSVFRVHETTSEIDDRTIRAVVYQDEERRNDEVRTLYSKLDDFERLMSKTAWRPNVAKSMAKTKFRTVLRMFDLSPSDDGTVRAVRHRNAIAAAENRCGKLILLTTSGDDWDELLARYRKRNDVEDDFGVLKSDLEGGVKHMSSNDSVEGLIFIEFLALILRTVLLSRIKGSELKGKVWVPDVFGILNKLKITRIGEEWRLNEVTKKQRELYETLGAEPPSGVH